MARTLPTFDDSFWEEEAKAAVRSAWAAAELDDVRGVIELYDSYDGQRGTECDSVEALQAALATIYDEAWYAHVPFDSGDAVFDGDSDGYVSDFLSDHSEADEFFRSLRVEDSEEDLFQSDEAVERGQSRILQLDLTEINDELIKRLASRPELMRSLHPRKFEELIAELLRDRGYEVQLTPSSKDGGRDILAIKREDIGCALTLVECKRYAEGNRVGVDVVRGLYGVVSAENATKGLIATTSYFTSGAKAFRDRVQYRLSLADFDVLQSMLHDFRRKR